MNRVGLLTNVNDVSVPTSGEPISTKAPSRHVLHQPYFKNIQLNEPSSQARYHVATPPNMTSHHQRHRSDVYEIPVSDSSALAD